MNFIRRIDNDALPSSVLQPTNDWQRQGEVEIKKCITKSAQPALKANDFAASFLWEVVLLSSDIPLPATQSVETVEKVYKCAK